MKVLSWQVSSINWRWGIVSQALKVFLRVQLTNNSLHMIPVFISLGSSIIPSLDSIRKRVEFKDPFEKSSVQSGHEQIDKSLIIIASRNTGFEKEKFKPNNEFISLHGPLSQLINIMNGISSFILILKGFLEIIPHNLQERKYIYPFNSV